MRTLLETRLTHERDAVAVRQAARQVARLLGFEHHDQIRIATAVSELVRAALGDLGAEAFVELLVTQRTVPQQLVIRVTSEHGNTGPQAVDAYRGEGTISAQRLLRRYVEAEPGPETIALARELPRGAAIVGAKRAREIREIIEQADAAATEGYLRELRQQNRELSSTLFELERKQEELTRLNAELADTNRGVMALYAELDERANHLRRADETKTKFLSQMSHEIRTPLSSIRTLAQLLLAQTDGPLVAEQVRQVQLIRDSAGDMLELVGDLLDLAKVEAGKTTLSVGEFTVHSLFGVLRGMMRPLLSTPRVSLQFDEGDDLPPIVGDEGKVAQILRNFLSNAVKFTEHGSITVGARHIAAGEPLPGSEVVPSIESVVFCVSDTGIGISAQDQEFIFDEFTQIRHDLQRNLRGTGLGLPLCRNLATLMEGHVWVESEPGKGSRFYLLIPRFFRPADVHTLAPRQTPAVPARGAMPKLPLLVVSEIDGHRRRLQDLFVGTVFAPVSLEGASVGPDYLSALRPYAAVVDVSPALPVAPRALEMLRSAGIPVVPTSDTPTAGSAHVPLDGDVAGAVHRESLRSAGGRVMIVDDDDRFRTVLLKLLLPICPRAYAIGEPHAALDAAMAGCADAVVLDLMMDDLDGFTLLAMLRDKPATAGVPVLACSSKSLSPQEHRKLKELRAPFLSKDELGADRLVSGLLEARALCSPPFARHGAESAAQ